MIPRLKKALCQKNGCTHDLSLCDDESFVCVSWKPSREMPNIPKMATSFVISVIEEGKARLSGEKMSEETSKERLEICNRCAFLIEGRCQKCGCVVSWKTKFISAKCPVGKW